LVISGYRGVAEYRQRAGSDLQNIAHVHRPSTLSEADARSLISIGTAFRFPMYPTMPHIGLLWVGEEME